MQSKETWDHDDDHDLKRRPFLGPFNIMRNLHTHDKLDFDVAKQIVIFAPLTALQLHFQDGTVTHLGPWTRFSWWSLDLAFTAFGPSDILEVNYTVFVICCRRRWQSLYDRWQSVLSLVLIFHDWHILKNKNFTPCRRIRSVALLQLPSD